MFDAHTHIDTIREEDIEHMAIAGIQYAVICSACVGATYPETYLDHYNQLIKTHCKRVVEKGITPIIALGIHPYGIPKNYDFVLKKLPKYIQNENVAAIGEIGLNINSEVEQTVLKSHLEIAKDSDVPAIIHIPRTKRKEIVEKIFEIAKEVEINPKRLIVDHASPEVVKYIIDFGSTPGFTVLRPGRLTFQELEDVLKEHGPVGLLNSDAVSLGPSDPLAVPKAVHHLRIKGFDENVIKKLSLENAKRLFNLE